MRSRTTEPKNATQTTILLVDDHPAIRKATRDAIEASDINGVVIETGTLESARLSLARECIDTVVFDLELPDGSGADLLDSRRAKHRDDCNHSLPTGFICLTMHSDIHTVIRTITAGADAFLSKESPAEEVVVAIRAISDGQGYMCRRTTKTLTGWIQAHPNLTDTLVDPKYQQLSPKEKEVFRLLAEGYGTAEIARTLSVSKKTVANYRLRIFSALGVTTMRELKLFAEENLPLMVNR